MYDVATINLGSLSGVPDNATVSFEVEYAGDMDASNNSVQPTFEYAPESGNDVELSILTDSWPEEISWELIAPWGGVPYSGGNYSEVSTEYTENLTLSAGCWTLNVYDTYGDGVNGSIYGTNAGNGQDGLIQVSDNQGVLWNSIAYGSLGSFTFEVTNAIGIEEISEHDISIFPNPFADYTNVSVYSKNGENTDISIYNTIGSKVYSKHLSLSKGLNNIKLESGDLSPGTYYVNIVVDGETHLKRLSIVK